MSYLVLARKYRPQTFQEVVGQDHVTQTLTNAIEMGRVAHAMLFAGPRGTGKTTIARILAKAINCKEGPTPTPCNQCGSCKEITSGGAADVFEIDGASNNSVDQIRDLRDNVHYMPAHSRRKIYIIDEVHMLSVAAFNALLKTLEEPPAHIQFMFATTEAGKIPVTILSRCQRHDLRRVNLDLIAAHLQTLCINESQEIPQESLSQIAREARGSIRDALSLLDQVFTCSQGPVTHAAVMEIMGAIDREALFDLSRAILTADAGQMLAVIEQCFDRGYDLKRLYDDLLENFRNLLVLGLDRESRSLVDLPPHEIETLNDMAQGISPMHLSQIFDTLFEAENAIRYANHPKLALEMACFRLTNLQPALPIDVLIEKLDELSRNIETTVVAAPVQPGERTQAIGKPSHVTDPTTARRSATPPDAVPQAETPASAVKDDPLDLDSTWKRFHDQLSQRYPALGANLARSRIKQLTDKDLVIEVNGNSFNASMVQREKNKKILTDLAAELLGRTVKVVITVMVDNSEVKHSQRTEAVKKVTQEALSHPLVSEAVEIFKGKIVDVKVDQEEQ